MGTRKAHLGEKKPGTTTLSKEDLAKLVAKGQPKIKKKSKKPEMAKK